MKQKILAFDTDDEGHWRAELECGHFQHLRHDPPLTDRPWVLEAAERQKRIGIGLECRKCDEASPE